jgi:hypothetical protein
MKPKGSPLAKKKGLKTVFQSLEKMDVNFFDIKPEIKPVTRQQSNESMLSGISCISGDSSKFNGSPFRNVSIKRVTIESSVSECIEESQDESS